MSKIKTKQKPVTDSKSQYLGKQILSLMDEYSRYNQIFIVEEETELRKKKKKKQEDRTKFQEEKKCIKRLSSF
jgi:lysyl-tRNA synthetase class I